MKRIILVLCISNSCCFIAMDAPRGALARRSSSGHLSTQIRHKRGNSLGQNVLSLLRPSHEDCSNNVIALATDRRTPEQRSLPELNGNDVTAKNDSRDFLSRAAEKNRIDFNEKFRSANTFLASIKEIDDEADKQFKSDIKYARYYYKTWLSLAFTKDPATLEKMLNEQFNQLENSHKTKTAYLQRKKEKPL